MHLQPKEARDVQRLYAVDGVPREVLAAGVAASWIRNCATASIRIHLLLTRDAWVEVFRLCGQVDPLIPEGTIAYQFRDATPGPTRPR